MTTESSFDVQQRIQACLQRLWTAPEEPRFKSSYITPIATLLRWIFTPQEMFVVLVYPKIQPTLPDEVATHVPTSTPSHPTDTSGSARQIGASSGARPDLTPAIDQYGCRVAAKGQPGTYFAPDIVVIKASADPHGDEILALFKIKKSVREERSGINEVERYLDKLQTKPLLNKFVAVLCMGEHTRLWTTPSSRPAERRRQVLQPGYIETGGTEFCKILRGIQVVYAENSVTDS